MEIILVLALKVRREHRVDNASMNMIRLSVTMIRLGMDMKQWKHEYPRDQPEQAKYAYSRHS